VHQIYFDKLKNLPTITVVIVMFITVLSFTPPASASEASNVDQEIQSLITTKSFAQALNLMGLKPISEQNSFDHRFLKGRILSWKGDYTQGRNVLSALKTDYPGNDDINFALGNLEYYQGNLKAAESIFAGILDRNPNYSDVATALDNVRKAKRSNRAYNWRIDGGIGQSSFDESNLENWNNQFLRIEYAPGDIAYHAKVQNYKRFGSNNVQFEGGLASAKRGNWDWGVAAGFTPEAVFRPESHYGGRVGRKFKLENGPTVVATLNYRYDRYTDAKIHNITPEVTAYFQNGARLTGRMINTVQSEESDQTGWLVNGSYPVADKWRLNAGIAQAPETVSGLVVNTKSVFGGVSYAVSPQLELHVNVTRDNREDTYIRNAVNVGFTQKF